MTLAKKVYLSVALLFSLFIIAFMTFYVARVAIVKSISQEQLALYQANISCLDFTIANDLTLNIKKLCLKTPQADFELNTVKVKLDLIAEQKIKHVEIRSMSIDANTALLDAFKEQPEENNTLSAAQRLNITLTKLSKLQLPFTLNVNEFHYSPFNTKSNSYSGKFSATNTNLQLALKDPQQKTVFSANIFELKNKQFKAEIISDLTPLKNFILSHQLPLQASLLDTLALTTLEGLFHSDVDYDAGKLSIVSQLNNVSILSTKGIQTSGPFALSGALNINSQITLPSTSLLSASDELTNKSANVDLEFKKQNRLQLKFSPQHLLDYLKQEAFSNELTTLLADNPFEQIAVTPEGKLTYNLNNHRISLSTLILAAKNDKQKHQLALNNIKVDIAHFLRHKNLQEPLHQNEMDETKNAVYLDFKLNSPLIINALKNYSHSPVELLLQGSFEQDSLKSKIHFDESSTITGNNIIGFSAEKTTDKNRLAIKQVTTKVQGDIKVSTRVKSSNNTQSNNQENHQPPISLNLSLNTQAKKLRYANIAEIKTLSLSSGITGSFDDIKLQTSIIADSLLLGELKVSGAVEKPKISLAVNQLPLTDLLALNIKLPTEINLVAGTLSYSVNGQVIDLNNFQDSTFELSLHVSSLSGEVADIWIQELNWQQNFKFLNNELSSIDGTNKTRQDNLTIALIETPTPVSQFSINTHWHYQKEFKISATNLKGDILGGSFAIPKIQWPLQHDHSVDVQLIHIDLAQVLALDKKQGIVVTGDISGQLPILYDGEKYTIEKGELHNVSNGLIQVKDNPAVVRLKANNTQLQLAFDALQNLHYHQLSSDVSMADDGYMLLETVIKGRNPDIDNDVNLNLNLSYDLLGLLESISITKQFEERIIKGLQKH